MRNPLGCVDQGQAPTGIWQNIQKVSCIKLQYMDEHFSFESGTVSSTQDQAQRNTEMAD